jgi:hypothetical protein
MLLYFVNQSSVVVSSAYDVTVVNKFNSKLLLYILNYFRNKEK